MDKKAPLCVDLDGTLIRTDLLFESLLVLLKRQPWTIFLVPFWLSCGRSALKHQIAMRVELEVETLPYQSDLVEFLKQEQLSGRSLVLTTAAHHRYAYQVAEHLGVFSQVHASNSRCNFSGYTKRRVLVETFGPKGFGYVGNSRDDFPVWGMAEHGIVVNPTRGVFEQAAALCPIVRSFGNERPTFATYARALRVHQWLKNLLVVLPLLLAHKILNEKLWIEAWLTFAAFSFCASSGYLLNDLLDLSADRRHPRKRLRPFACGELPLAHGLILMPLLLLLAFATAILFLPLALSVVLTGYFLLTISYSLWLKSIVLLDALLLAGLYTIRIIGGAVATRMNLSFWLLAFSIFLFFSLALVKRYSELLVLKQRGQMTAHGRGYRMEDLVLLMVFGIASGFLAVLVAALYLNRPQLEELYPHPVYLWLIPPILLYWVSRLWLITHRGGMHDDPVIFAVKDPGSWFTAAVITALLTAASL